MILYSIMKQFAWATVNKPTVANVSFHQRLIAVNWWASRKCLLSCDSLCLAAGDDARAAASSIAVQHPHPLCVCVQLHFAPRRGGEGRGGGERGGGGGGGEGEEEKKRENVNHVHVRCTRVCGPYPARPDKRAHFATGRKEGRTAPCLDPPPHPPPPQKNLVHTVYYTTFFPVL